MTTKLKPTGAPMRRPDLLLSDPIWTVKHVAKAFNMTEDRARRHTYRPDFPRPKQGFDTNLYCREAVLAWFRDLDEIPATAAMERRAREVAKATQAPTRTPAARRVSPGPASTASTTSTTSTASTTARRTTSGPTYRPRRGR